MSYSQCSLCLIITIVMSYSQCSLCLIITIVMSYSQCSLCLQYYNRNVLLSMFSMFNNNNRNVLLSMFSLFNDNNCNVLLSMFSMDSLYTSSTGFSSNSMAIGSMLLPPATVANTFWNSRSNSFFFSLNSSISGPVGSFYIKSSTVYISINNRNSYQ